MIPPRPRHRPLRASFTLVELLVAIAVLSIMLISLATAMGFVSRLWLSGVGSMDNFTKARLVLNLLDRDIQTMVMRRDMPAFVDNNSPPNPACAFYANIEGNPGATSTVRTLSLVQYSLTNSTSPPVSALNRLNLGMNYTTTSPLIASSSISSLSQLTSSSAQTDTVFTGVIQFQIQFIDGNGAILTPTTTTGTMTSGGPFTYDYTNPGAASNPRTVIVSMLVLSNPAYIIAVQSGTLQTLVNCFSTTTVPLTTANPTYSQAWNAFLAAPNSTFLALPESIRRGIQVFERHIPLPITTPSSS